MILCSNRQYGVRQAKFASFCENRGFAMVVLEVVLLEFLDGGGGYGSYSEA